MNRSNSIALALGLGLGFGSVVACDIPECIEGPHNLTPEVIAECEAPPEDSTPEPEVQSAGAELLDDGSLVLTLSSNALECGTRARHITLPEDCSMEGYTFTIVIPPELAVAGTIQMTDHPEIGGTITVLDGMNGGSFGQSDDQATVYVGELELTAITDGCVTGVLREFGSGRQGSLGGPELNGSFVAPRC